MKDTLVETTLRTLHRDAKKDYMRIGKGVVKSIFRPIQPADFEHAYLPISREQGESMRELIVVNNCKNVVEFGTSFGISTIYLADAVRQTGGRVVTTELLASKVAKAKMNVHEAGLGDYVEFLEGDAMLTLKSHDQPIDFLFLDGWKDLYLPLFQLLEPLLHSGSLIYADNMNMAGTQPYADYILGREDQYSSLPVDNGKAYVSRAC